MHKTANLIEELHEHDRRLVRILEMMSKSGFYDPSNIFNIMPELKGIPVSFSNGETWTLMKITKKLYEKKDGSRTVWVYYYHFTDENGNKAVHRTYFGNSKAAQHVLELYQDEWNMEWWERKKPTTLLNAAERICNNILEQERENQNE